MHIDTWLTGAEDDDDDDEGPPFSQGNADDVEAPPCKAAQRGLNPDPGAARVPPLSMQGLTSACWMA